MILQLLKQKRLEKGLSLLDVSKQLGYKTANGYWKVETGAVNLTLKQLIKLIDILDIELEAVVMEVGNYELFE